MKPILLSFLSFSILASGIADAQTPRQLLNDARRGNVTAMRTLGKRLIQGKGIKHDPKNGVKWLEMAADKGDHRAMFMLGDLHYKGIAVSKDEEEAIRYYKMADELGNKNAADKLKKLGITSKADSKKKKRKEDINPTSESMDNIEEAEEAEAEAKQEAEAKAKQEAEAKAKQEAEAKAKQEAEAKAKQEAEIARRLQQYPPLLLDFQKAVKKNEYWKYEDFIAKGVDIHHNLINNQGEQEENYTPLDCCLFDNDFEGAKILIKHGADINKTRNKDRLWVEIMKYEYVDKSKMTTFFIWLIDNNVHLKPSLAYKDTLMHVAVLCGNGTIASKLISKGVDIDIPREGGVTPLLDVTIWITRGIGRLENALTKRDVDTLVPMIQQKLNMLSELLKAGANPNIQGSFTFDYENLSSRSAYTHTILSAGFGKNIQFYYDLVTLLHRNGANPALRNKDGLNALEELILSKEDKEPRDGQILLGDSRDFAKLFIDKNIIISNPKVLEILKKDAELFYLYQQKHK